MYFIPIWILFQNMFLWQMFPLQQKKLKKISILSRHSDLKYFKKFNLCNTRHLFWNIFCFVSEQPWKPEGKFQNKCMYHSYTYFFIGVFLSWFAYCASLKRNYLYSLLVYQINTYNVSNTYTLKTELVVGEEIRVLCWKETFLYYVCGTNHVQISYCLMKKFPKINKRGGTIISVFRVLAKP